MLSWVMLLTAARYATPGSQWWETQRHPKTSLPSRHFRPAAPQAGPADVSSERHATCDATREASSTSLLNSATMSVALCSSSDPQACTVTRVPSTHGPRLSAESRRHLAGFHDCGTQLSIRRCGISSGRCQLQRHGRRGEGRHHRTHRRAQFLPLSKNATSTPAQERRSFDNKSQTEAAR